MKFANSWNHWIEKNSFQGKCREQRRLLNSSNLLLQLLISQRECWNVKNDGSIKIILYFLILFFGQILNFYPASVKHIDFTLENNSKVELIIKKEPVHLRHQESFFSENQWIKNARCNAYMIIAAWMIRSNTICFLSEPYSTH